MHTRLFASCLLLPVCMAAQTPAHLKAAREVLELGGFPAALQAEDSAFVGQYLRVSPAWEPYRDILQEWADSIYNWRNLEPALSAKLAQVYSLEDLQALAAFYRTPAGSRWVAIRPQLQLYLNQFALSLRVRLSPSMNAKLRDRARRLHQELPPMRSD